MCDADFEGLLCICLYIIHLFICTGHLFDATLFCSVLTHTVMFFRMIRFKILICFKMLNICYIVIKLYTFFEESKVICSHVGKTELNPVNSLISEAVCNFHNCSLV